MRESDSTFNIYEDGMPATRICPKCAQAARCYCPAESLYFSCPNCNTYFRAGPGEQPTLIQRPVAPRAGPGPWLALGSEGTLSGYRVRVTGYQVRGEKGDKLARWGEYQLSPADGTTKAAAAKDPAFPLQLAEYQGHWLLIRPAKTGPKPVPARGVDWQDPTDGDRIYRLWHRYEPRILEVYGEFDSNVLEDEKLNIVELTGPPYQLIGERASGKTYTWYRARYVERQQIAAAFGLQPSQLPERIGVGAAQPPPGNVNWARLLRLAWISGVVLLVLQALLLLRPAPVVLNQEFMLAPRAATADSLLARYQRAQQAVSTDSLSNIQRASIPVTVEEAQEKQVYDFEISDKLAQTRQSALAALTNAPLPAVTFVSRSFQVDGPTSLDLELSVPDLSNNWVEVSASIINEQTGSAYEATRAIEYYSGVEGGESWSEGRHSESVNFNAVPTGRYHVNLYPTADPAHPATGPLSVQVAADTSLWSNFWLALLVLVVPVVVLWIRRQSFEKSRGENSDYGPVTEDE
jgi:hypothetical protein